MKPARPNTSWIIGAALCMLLVHSSHALTEEPSPPGVAEQLFAEQVGPLLVARCGQCHGGTQPKAKLDLATAAGILAGGESGPLLVAGKPDQSLLMEMVIEGEMPPKGKTPLTDQELKLLARWISAGAATSAASTPDKDGASDPAATLHRLPRDANSRGRAGLENSRIYCPGWQIGAGHCAG